MTYTKDYYAVLGLDAQRQKPTQISSTDIRRAYKLALLAAHPDKQATTTTTTTTSQTTPQQQQQHTIDNIKEAYAKLSHPQTKRDYDASMLANPGLLSRDHDAASICGVAVGPSAPAFLSGLDVLDLSDFDVWDPRSRVEGLLPEDGGGGGGGGDGARGEGLMVWTRACRCGFAQGYRICEEELEDAVGRGEGEVLVGCGGCSLWVRVGFGVED
ncbi:hypothetical protein BDU57DRAFT_501729 [Ampelomyces quisqualis]|uniref:Diphthamide biosynthesis protein 4 n=1 Tax=Ampelomyces quisqualis TaxID=50730 RepID=A0A6A5QKD4_AMPQU|nr:hypothetical protein BDU57DRAFT_501729 [Ampelomyces quisqualis]